MNYAIVYSSRTGNTEQLARAVRAALPAADCLYCGAPDDAALAAERIYAGFWTDRGCCDGQTASFLRRLTGQELFLFGTAGFGGSPEYFDQVLRRTEQHLSPAVHLTGSFMCQGRMPPAVRERYEKMLQNPAQAGRAQGLIENFDRALSHPDTGDLVRLTAAVQKQL